MVCPPFKYQGISVSINEARFYAMERRDGRPFSWDSIFWFAKFCPLLKIDPKQHSGGQLWVDHSVKYRITKMARPVELDRGVAQLVFVYLHLEPA